jgi:hypothetical protein
LTSDSPSSTAAIRSGTPSRRITAVAATGSVGPTTAPSTKADGHDSPAAACATTATPTAVAATSPTASNTISVAAARNASEE